MVHSKRVDSSLTLTTGKFTLGQVLSAKYVKYNRFYDGKIILNKMKTSMS